MSNPLDKYIHPLPDELAIDSDLVAQVEDLTDTLNKVIAYLRAKEKS